MNKKFFSALLLGSLVMGGTFVSCSDYDDDIENLQGQIDKLAGKAELDSQVSSLSSQISAAQGAADAAKTAAAAAQAAADAAKSVADSKLDEAAVKAIAEAAAEGAAAAAQEGKDAAAVAQAAADAAQAAADAAQATADKGVSAAEAAQAAADAAAAAAQKTADKLAEYATKAELKAAQEVAAAAAEAAKKAGLDAAKVAADAAAAAQKTADEAVAAAKKAAEDAAAAKKAGVEAAAEAAKKAEAAQKTADEAVAAAEAAKKAADAAKKAADAAQATADAAKSAAEKVAADLTALEARVKALETSLAALLDKDGLNELLKNVEQLKQDADKIFPVVANYITSVDLYTSSSLVGGVANPLPSLNFTKAIEKKTSFGPNDEIKFEDGKVRTYDKTVTIRVSPVTADLTKDMISLINSQGASLGEFVRVKEIKRNTDLVTRAAESGLWDVTFELIEENYTDAKFMSATRIDSNKDGKLTAADKQICFAIAINNTGIEDRLVVSAYDVVASYNNAARFDNLQFTVNNVQADEIHNRYTVCEDGTSTTTVSELAYYTNNPVPGFAVPVVKEQFVSKTNTQGYDNKYNVINLKNTSYASDGGYVNRDDRQGKNFLVAGVGEDITITVNNTQYGSTWSTAGKDIRALYVTFDEKNGIESAPSEINAWNSYKANIENLGKVVEGNTVTLKINDKSADGDVIGFRVYAVNLDGTVIDPDGRAFYVAVGNYSEASSVVETIINAFKKLTVSSNAVEVPAGFFPAHTANITLSAGQLPLGNEFERIVVADNNPKYGATPTASPAVTYTFYQDANATILATKVSEAKYAVATFADASQYIDGETYSQTIKVRKSINPGSSSTTPQYVDVKTIKFTTKKNMPTTFPADFAFRPMQEITAGSGKFRSYMVPGTDPTINDYATAATVGSKDLNNIFYGLDDNYKFSIAKSVWDAATWSYSENKYVTYNGTAPAINYIFDVDAALIDGQTEHAITASYMYRNVSTKKNNDGTWSVGVDYPVNYGQNLAIIYDCWFNASTFAWWTGETATGTSSTGATIYSPFNKQPVLQWSANPTTNTTCSLSDIVSTNTYNNSFFGTVYGDSHKSTISSGNLDDLVNTKGWLTIDGTSNIHLMYGNQVDPYFTVSYSAGTITFNQAATQVDANPTADHKETLVIPVKDAYGHKTTIQLEVLVKKAI